MQRGPGARARERKARGPGRAGAAFRGLLPGQGPNFGAVMEGDRCRLVPCTRPSGNLAGGEVGAELHDFFFFQAPSVFVLVLEEVHRIAVIPAFPEFSTAT